MKRRAPRPPLQSGGLTLVEVLVALSITAIALMAGFKSAQALAGNAARISETIIANWCAENALTNLRLARQFPGIGVTRFECRQWGREYVGELQTRATPNPGFRRVDAQVLESTAPQARVLLHLIALVPKP